MTTDKTAFDDYLKENLARDIAFRVFVWMGIAFLTAKYASVPATFRSPDYLNRVIETLSPPMATVMVYCLVLGLLALLLKDLEHVSPIMWGQKSRLGRVGGFVRRLAGDLSLWVIGAMVTILGVVLFTAIDLAQLGAPKSGVIALFAFSLVPTIAIVTLSALNVLIRRLPPPFAQHGKFADFLTSPTRVLVVYALLIGTTWLFGHR